MMSDEDLENRYGIHILRLPDPIDPSLTVDVVGVEEVRALVEPMNLGVREYQLEELIRAHTENYEGWAERLRKDPRQNVDVLTMMLRCAQTVDVLEGLRHTYFDVPRWIAEEQAREEEPK